MMHLTRTPTNLFNSDATMRSDSSSSCEATAYKFPLSVVKKKQIQTTPRNVSFNKSVRVIRSGLTLDEYTHDEVLACWCTQEECSDITSECLKITAKMIKGKPINTCKYSIRGLEHHTPQGAAIKALNKVEAYLAVLAEQSKQLHEGRSDPKEIARRYRNAAAEKCRCEAAKIGHRDELVMREDGRCRSCRDISEESSRTAKLCRSAAQE